MNRGAYTAGTGMMAQQRRLDVLANNLANVNTRGFKADRITFGDMMVRAMADDGGDGNIIGQMASGPTVEKQYVDFTQGSLEQTGNPLDVAVKGSGMFAIQTKGGVQYTRNGEFKVNATGGLVTLDGDAVLDSDLKPITGIDSAVTVEKTGKIHHASKKDDLGTIGIFDGTFTKDDGGKGLFNSTNARLLTGKDAPDLESGALETANVEPVSLMVEMIALQRSYEISQKMIQSQDDSTAKLNDTIA